MKLEAKILALLENDKPAVLITVIDKQGSGPRSPGAKIVLAEDGTFWGTIGGGQVEKRAIGFAETLFTSTTQAAVDHYQLKPGHEGENIDMLCGGRVSLLFERFAADEENRQLFRRFKELDETPGKGVWVIDLDAVDIRQQAQRTLLSRDETVSLRFAALQAQLFTGGKVGRKSHLLTVDGTSWFIDSFSSAGHLILIGAGHIALEVARLACSVDFDVSVCDNRPEFASAERFPMVDSVVVVAEYEAIFDQVSASDDAYIVILTHGHSYDQTALEQALQTDACYIGMIGSLRKRDAIYANLRDRGVSDDQLRSVYSPVGLDIGAESPVEIAMSIIAELISKRAA